MILPPQAVDGRLAVERFPQGNHGQGHLGAIGSGATAARVDAQACDLANLRFSGESARPKCVHREHVVVLDAHFGHIDMCGGTEHAAALGLGMGTECEGAGTSAILGRDVLRGLEISMEGPTGTGTTGGRASA